MMNLSPLIPTRAGKLAGLLLFVIAAAAVLETGVMFAQESGKSDTGKTMNAQDDPDKDTWISLKKPSGSKEKGKKTDKPAKSAGDKPAKSAGENRLGEGIGNTSLTWTTGGTPSVSGENVNWSYCTGDGHSGKVCVTSGAGGAGVATSWLRTTVEGPCTITFYYKVQTYGGEFRVDCDSDELLKVSMVTGTNPAWKFAKYPIPAGTHTITFTYRHPGQGYANQFNGVRLDDFKVTGASRPLLSNGSL